MKSPRREVWPVFGEMYLVKIQYSGIRIYSEPKFGFLCLTSGGYAILCVGNIL